MRKRTTSDSHISSACGNVKVRSSRNREDLKHGLRFLLIPVSALIAAFLLNKFVMISAIVPSESMADTIDEGTFLVASRLSYLNKTPERGDVIIFRHKELGDKYIVKRVIALPGETVEIKGGCVFVNGETLDERYVSLESDGSMEQMTVPDGELFVLGDNRASSFDSRYWEDKFVNVDEVCGKAVFTVFPKIGKIK